MEKEQVTRMQNSDLKELLEDVTLNEIHLSNEERQEMTSTFSQIIKKKKRKVQKKRIWSAVAICACVVVVVLGWYSMGQLTVFSAEKEGILVELPDHSVACLNRNTSLHYNRWGFRFFREVKLKGEAYFDVRKDVARRFIVHLKESNVTVLGTSFNIKAYGDEDYIYTTLVEGKVRFTSEKEHEEVTLRPGMQSVLNLKSGKTELKEVEVEQFTAWRQGRFVFPSTTLGDLMCQLKRWYDIDVVYLSPEAKGYEFRGAINRDMDLKNVLAIVEKTSNVVFDINGRTIKVTIKNE